MIRCSLCNRRQSSVHLTEVVDGTVMKAHLCEHCASKKGTAYDKSFGLTDLLKGLLDTPAPTNGGAPPEEKPERPLPAPGFVDQIQDAAELEEEAEVDILEEALDEAVQSEEYERAATIRDRLKNLSRKKG
ncbi:MAG: UvrB/UvrC motif-containing protein [Candidatus Omnitrophica bacterium]|nr:UvrB/UvrC motif-containing protein [Candidatus Omnitrophota bacterium]